MSDTPRTDRMVASWPLERFGEMTGLARQLERENATLAARVRELEPDAERWQAHQRLTWKTQKEADTYQAAIDAARGTK